jgi:hypothetical protein
MEERRRQVRRQAGEPIFVYDSQNGEVIGQIVNMTELGAMLLSEKPTKPRVTYQCKMTLPTKMRGNYHINFEAESKWCLLDRKTGMYRTGYEFQNLTPDKLTVIRAVVELWPVSQTMAVAP